MLLAMEALLLRNDEEYEGGMADLGSPKRMGGGRDSKGKASG